MIYRIEFETGDSLVTEDKELADLHREKGRLIVEIPGPTDKNDEDNRPN
jgi:hypothetical protein